MVTRRVVLLLVAATVLVAGCAGSDTRPSSTSDAGATIGTPNATTTTFAEAATPTESANATLPPGVNGTGVADATALVAANRAALGNASFAFRFGANVSVGPAVQWTVQRGTVGTGLSPIVLHSTSVRHLDSETSSVTTDLWANNETVVVKYHREKRTELRRYNRTSGNAGAYDETWAHLPRADLGSQVTQSWLVELALAVGEYDLANVERRDGHRLSVLRATEPVAAANVTDLNATLVVDEDGRVRSLSLTAAYAGDDATRVHYEFALTDVAGASVSRPEWVGAAIPPNATVGNATTTRPATTAAQETTAGNATTTERTADKRSTE